MTDDEPPVRPRRALIEPDPPQRALSPSKGEDRGPDTPHRALSPSKGEDRAPGTPHRALSPSKGEEEAEREAGVQLLAELTEEPLDEPAAGPPVRRATRRALPLRAEIVRQLRRRRTLGIFAVLTALPPILLLAFWAGGDDSSGRRGFVDLAQESGANLVVFTMFASTSFLLIVIVALFAGDTVPSEASWSSLRYLLAAPVRRERLLRQKLIVAGLSSVVALVYLPLWTLLVGGIAYGFGPYVGPTGDQLRLPVFLGRLALIVAYLLVELTVVAAFAFLLGVLTDAPLAAVGGAVLLMILAAILDSITALGDIRNGLPGHYAYAWADALAPTLDLSDMATGSLWSLLYAIVLTGVAVWRFVRKDITS